MKVTKINDNIGFLFKVIVDLSAFKSLNTNRF